MKKLLHSVLPVFALSVVMAADVREEILVIVNGHTITRRSFQQSVEQDAAALYRQFSGKQLDEKLRDAREKTLQGLVDAFVLQDKANEIGIVIPDDYMRSVVDDMKKQYNFATDADFEKALKGSVGIGLPDWIKQQKLQLTQQEVLRKEVYAKIAIEDQELRAFYEDHKDEYRMPSRFRIRELVLAKGATAEEQAAAKAKVEEIQAALKAGKSFEDMVKEHSVSPSKSLGGDLGWIGKGLMRQAIEQAALSMKADQVSAPIETDKDIYLIQLIAAEDDVVKPFTEVKAQILQKLQEPKAQNAIQNYLQGLRIRANVRYLVPKETILKG
ncbi:MAG: peptidyl-prolyl cis-trans isomerase [Holophaga sp.]|nr:peptidyl-prolyl cis-trans isomerase [Holophaga sp.]